MRRYNIPQSKKKSGESKSENRRSKINKYEVSIMKDMSRYEQMMDKCDNDAALCLFVAVICRVPEQVKLRLKTGANLVLNGCYTPLHFLYLDEVPNTVDNSYPIINRVILDKNTKAIIDLLTSAGARLLPDSCGLTPLSISAWKSSKMGQYLMATANCTVSDVINYRYFSLPPQKLVKPNNVTMNSIRLKRTLLLHIKHGVTPHYIPTDTSRRFLNCISDTKVTDSFQVYSSQLSSYFNLVDTPGKFLFPGVYFLLHQVVETPVSDSAEFDNYFSLFDTLMSWLNLHPSLPPQDIVVCWKCIVKSFECEQVRENFSLFVPAVLCFLRKFLLPQIHAKYSSWSISEAVGDVILFLKLASDYKHSQFIFHHEIQQIFDSFYKKNLIMMSLHNICSTRGTVRSSIINRVELLHFAMSFAFNLNESVCKYSENTVLHLAAIACDAELIRIYLNAGVSPMIKNASGETFLFILRKKNFSLHTVICQEFDLGKPYKLMVLSAYMYIHYRFPLKHLHKHGRLRRFVIQLSTSQECKQMCPHCYKEYYL